MKSIISKASAALIGLVALPMAAHATAVIQDGYVQAGVSDYGTLGSDYTTPPGILFDSTGMGNYGINDFLTPGRPFEGFYVTGSGGSYGSNNEAGSSSDFNTFTLTQSSPTTVSAYGTSLNGLLGVTNQYSLTTIAGRSVIAITTTLTNLSSAAMTSLAFLRTLDPDPDVNAFGSYDTVNTIASPDEACGTGTDTDETICIYSTSSYAHKVGISLTPWSTSPADYLAGVNDGNGDNAIGVAFDLGTLGAGDSMTISYGYALGASHEVASGVPEPMSLLLVGLGLLGVVQSRRRKV